MSILYGPQNVRGKPALDYTDDALLRFFCIITHVLVRACGRGSDNSLPCSHGLDWTNHNLDINKEKAMDFRKNCLEPNQKLAAPNQSNNPTYWRVTSEYIYYDVIKFHKAVGSIWWQIMYKVVGSCL